MKKQHGYLQEVAYPAHFHRELQPVWLTSLVDFLGATAPAIARPYAYCELGCGVGINLLVAAACNPEGQFVGVDFNQKHLAIAQDAANAAGLRNIRLIQADFADFARNNNLFFDFIVSHGVWSWIAPAQQAGILQLLERSLKPGGLFYLHYMCHPGATQMIPVQKLLNELARHLSASAEQNVRAGLDLLGRLDQAGAFSDQPRLSASLQALQGMDAAYLAHDFLADHWRPQHSMDVHRLAAQAGLTYLGSADPFENLDRLSIPGAIQPLLAGLPSPALRELLKDMARHQHQRRDLFQRGAVALSAEEHLARVDALRFRSLAAAPLAGGLRFETPIGPIEGPADVFSPLLERLARGPASFAELRQAPAFAGNLGLLSQSLQMLQWQGHIHPLREGPAAPAEALERLQEWFARQQVRLHLLQDCGTAQVPPTASR